MARISQVSALFARSAPAPAPLAPSLDAAADWIARAQDSGDDDGVAAYYDVKTRQWQASYPETTGYIIPTCYAYAARTGRDDFFERATRMADWECDIQLGDGGVRAGNMNAPTIAPTIFNTGQVLFGWAAAYEQTRRERFSESLRRAADWLVAAQDDDGAWRRYASPFAAHAVNAYNTRVAAGLARAYKVTADARYADAARANVEWALQQRQANGWFDCNDLEDNERPLTHTIAYVTRGVLEVGAWLGEQRYVDKAARTAAAVVRTQRGNGALPGRLDRDWRSAARWSCLTGNAQMAIIWLRLAALNREPAWVAPARRAVAYLRATQRTSHRDPGRRGGIAGSAPLRGEYMRYRYPNWATKFFMDAVMALDAATERRDA